MEKFQSSLWVNRSWRRGNSSSGGGVEHDNANVKNVLDSKRRLPNHLIKKMELWLTPDRLPFMF